MFVIFYCNRVQTEDKSSPLRKRRLHSPLNAAATCSKGSLTSMVIHIYEFL